MIVASIFLGVIFTLFIVLFFRDYYVKLRVQRMASEKYSAMKAFIEKLAVNTPVTEYELLEIAKDASLRIPLFHALKAYNREDRFPTEFYTQEKGAESYMVNWLEFPTELGVAPDEIQLMQLVALELNTRLHYYVFKFRTSKPRWARSLNWMMGVCGPYNESSQPFDIPKRIFSRFKKIGDADPQTEVMWVHDNISKTA